MTQGIKYELCIKGGHVVDPANKVDDVRDVAICEGKILAVAPELDCSAAVQVVAGKGLVVMPGIIDSHAHVARPKALGAGFRMLVKAGITTVVDFEGPTSELANEIQSYGCGLNVAVLEGIRAGAGVSKVDAPHKEVSEKINSSLDMGAIGVKILGGHYPLTPETTADFIETAAREGAYVALHAGSTATGSNILGLEEAVRLAAGHPLHIAHVNAYCRGLVEHPLHELYRAMEVIKQNDNIVSESHLAPFNGCSGSIGKDGLVESYVTRNCLRTFGYSVNKDGMERAILDGVASVYARVGEEMELLWKKKAHKRWLGEGTRLGTSFPVNLRVSAMVCATEKDEKGKFVVDAISSDGGAIPRNFILSYGINLVHFGALTMSEMVLKASYNPACLFGLTNKGHLSPGADADLILLDPQTGKVSLTIIDGRFAMVGGIPIKRGGCILTSQRGTPFLKKKKVHYKVIDLKDSSYLKNVKIHH